MKRFARCRRAHLTLLEIMMVIALLAMSAGALALNISKAVRDQRFRSEVAIIAGQLRLAQELMLVVGSHVTVHFAENKAGQIDHWIEVDTPLPAQWQRQLDKRPPPLKAVHQIELLDSPRQGESGTLVLRFLARGTVMSRGLLRLSTSPRDSDYNALSRYICLPGYPAPISTATTKERAEACLKKSEGDEERQLTADLMEEVKPYQ